MKEKITITNDKDLLEEELIKLPVKELVLALHEAIKEWDNLNRQIDQSWTKRKSDSGTSLASRNRFSQPLRIQPPLIGSSSIGVKQFCIRTCVRL
jgi:hypothetical protein